MSIRLATPADLPALVALMRGYYRDDHLAFDEARATAVMTRLLHEPQWGFALLHQSFKTAEPVGYVAVCIGFSLELGGCDAYIDELFIASEHRRRGYALQLMTAAAVEAQRRGVVALHLEVDRDNEAAQTLYESLGYTKRDRYFLMTRRLDHAQAHSE